MTEGRRFLICANQTAAGDTLLDATARCKADGACTFDLVVPATHPRDHLTWHEGTAHGLAHRRLLDALAKLREAGFDVNGWVGDENPYRAIADALTVGHYDEVVLSTFPAGISRWLRMDVASRIHANYGIPVRLVTSDRVPVHSSTE